MVHHRADWLDAHPPTRFRFWANDFAHINQEDGEPLGLACHLFTRRCARKQHHQVGIFCTTGPDLLAIDDIFVTVPHSYSPQRKRVGAAGRFRNTKGLQTQFSCRDAWQIFLLLFFAAIF